MIPELENYVDSRTPKERAEDAEAFDKAVTTSTS
jgi:hypothetical protein